MSLQKSPTSHIKSVFCCPISQFTWLQPNAATKSPSASGATVQPNSWLHHCCIQHFCTKIKKFKQQFVYSEPRIRVSNWCLPCTLARAHTDCPGGFEAISSLHGENAAAKLPHPKEQAVPSALFQHCLAWQAEFNQFQGLLKAKTTNPIVNAQGSDPCVIANIPQFPLTSHPENGEWI